MISILPLFSAALVLIVVTIRILCQRRSSRNCLLQARNYTEIVTSFIHLKRASFLFLYDFALIILILWEFVSTNIIIGRTLGHWEAAFTTGSGISRLSIGATMFKDPWYDSMYVL